MLILFDIDGTILHSQGAGIRAMERAGRAMFGQSFSVEGLNYAGMLDPLIWRTLCAMNNIPDADDHHEAFREAYGQQLAQGFAKASTAELLPGVPELVDALLAQENLVIGLLTGNYPETGRLKIQTAGLDPDVFTVAAWGCDGACRRDLPPVAMRRLAESTGREVSPDKVLIIGDTPHDVDCAAINGCRSLAVATGRSSMEELAAMQPHLVVDTLEDTESLTGWILKSPDAISE